MRLSESLRRNVLEASGSGIINRFKMTLRRDVLCFESILAGYIRECERSGHAETMSAVAREWAFLYAGNFMPRAALSLPRTLLLNSLLPKVWRNIGLLEAFHASLGNGKLEITVRGEGITRTIGRNSFCQGLWQGVLESVLGEGLFLRSSFQDRERSRYSFSREGEPPSYTARGLDEYRRLNDITHSREGLRTHVRKGSISLRGNRLFYRGRPIVLGENTLFHLLGREGIMLESVREISGELFTSLLGPGSSHDDSMLFLKAMLQTFGWGSASIAMDGKKISVSIRNPPYGIQASDDCWDFLARMVQGFLCARVHDCSMDSAGLSGRSLSLRYSCR